jgi:hypothetical protein
MYMGKVNIDENPKLKEYFNITTIPTMYWVVDGETTLYKGRKTTEGMVHGAINRVDSAFDELDTCISIIDTAEEHKLNVFFFGDKMEGPLFDMFHSVAKDNEAYKFHMVDEQCTVDMEIPWGESIAIMRHFDTDEDNKIKVYKGPADDSDAFMSYLDYMEYEPLLRLHKDNISNIFGGKMKMVMLFQNTDHQAVRINNVFTEIAKEMEGLILTVFSGIKIEQEAHMAAHADVVVTPSIRILEPVDAILTQKYKYDVDNMYLANNATKEEIKEWIYEYLDGGLKPHYRSQKLPLRNW